MKFLRVEESIRGFYVLVFRKDVTRLSDRNPPLCYRTTELVKIPLSPESLYDLSNSINFIRTGD